MSEPSIAGMRVEGEKLSPDGRMVAYSWSANGKDPRDLHIVQISGDDCCTRITINAAPEPNESTANPPQTPETIDERNRTGKGSEDRPPKRDAVQEAREQSIAGIEWSPDSRRLLFVKRGDLYIVKLSEKNVPARRVTRTIALEGSARWLADSHRILYQSSGNLFVLDVDEASLVQLTREGGAAAARRSEDTAAQQGTGGQSANTSSVSGVQVSEDGNLVAYVVADNSKQRALFVPSYTGDFVTAPSVRRGWSDQRVQIVRTDGSTERATVAKLIAPEGVSYVRGIRWAFDNKGFVIDRIDRDTKRRQLFYVKADNGEATLIDEEIDPKWIASLSRFVEVSPKSDRLLFTSERDGFNHLYLVQLNRSASTNPAPVIQLTRGPWEVSWAKWMQDGDRVVYSSTEASTAERRFYVLNVRTNGIESLPLIRGMNTDPQISREGRILMFEHSEWNVPANLYFQPVCPGCKSPINPQSVTDTVPARFKEINWIQPVYFDFRARDGKTVKARVYLPRNFVKTNKYPAVVFVHGAGYIQNVINGWNNYYREAMFNHILAERGYVVLDIDYRGSAGYGREWRTDVFDYLGGLDLDDHVDLVDYAVMNYSVDPARVGMYGGSYGGFMAELAVMRAPEKFACAAALRPVADWKNYYASSPIYTTERLGFPDKNPEAYRRSSPITYADQIRRPLLILHGMVDDNVHFQDSVQLIQKLIELGKTEYFEAMIYPMENHTFARPESWTDEYERILRFMDQHLR